MRTTGPGIWSPASVLEAEQQTKIHSYIASHFIAQHHNIPLPLVNNATPLLQASLALANNNNNSIIKNNNGVGGKVSEGVKSKNSRANNGKSSPAHAALIQNNSNGTKDLIGATHNHANTKGSSKARASPVSVSSSTEVTTKTKKPKKSQNGSPRTFQVRFV